MQRACLILLLLLAGAPICAAQNDLLPQNLTQLFGKHGLQIVREPEVISAVLLKDRKGKLTERTRRVVLPPEAQRTAGALLSDRRSYAWGAWKPCMPVYGARLLIHRGQEIVSVDFCFGCDILQVPSSPHPDKDVNFDPSHATWFRLFREAFPKDRVLRSH